MLRTTGSTAHFTARALVAAVSCIALFAAACTGDAGLRAGDAASLAEDSPAEVSTTEGEWTTYDGGDVVPEGARVRATAGEAHLIFRDGVARLTPGATATVTASALTIERGDVLIDTGGGLSVVNADTEISGNGVMRVSTGLSSRVAVYRGTATVRRPAQEREVTALRQLELSDFRLAAEGDPLRYREGDAWDRELLADAITFDGEAARISRGIDVEFGTAPMRRAFYEEFTQDSVIGVLRATAPVSRGARFGPPSDVLLTAFVAAATGQHTALKDGVHAVAGLRDAGARWGLIAVELGVRSDAVVAAIDTISSDQLALVDRPDAASSGPGADAQDDDDQGASADSTAGNDGATSGEASGDDGGSDPQPPQPPPTDGDGDGGDGGDGGDPGTTTVPSDTESAKETAEEVVAEVVDQLPDDDDDDSKNGPSVPKAPDLPLIP